MSPVKPGDLVFGAKVIGTKGVKEWQPYPNYRVVALHICKPIFFVESVDENGNTVHEGYFTFYHFDSKQYKIFK